MPHLGLICIYLSRPANVACVQTSPLPQKKAGEETSVSRRRLSCSGIHLHKLIFVLSLTVEKAHVGRKIALASVYRLAEHLHAMFNQKSRYKISDYSQARSRVLPKIPFNVFIIRKLNRW